MCLTFKSTCGEYVGMLNSHPSTCIFKFIKNYVRKWLASSVCKAMHGKINNNNKANKDTRPPTTMRSYSIFQTPPCWASLHIIRSDLCCRGLMGRLSDPVSKISSNSSEEMQLIVKIKGKLGKKWRSVYHAYKYSLTNTKEWYFPIVICSRKEC